MREKKRARRWKNKTVGAAEAVLQIVFIKMQQTKRRKKKVFMWHCWCCHKEFFLPLAELQDSECIAKVETLKIFFLLVIDFFLTEEENKEA